MIFYFCSVGCGTVPVGHVLTELRTMSLILKSVPPFHRAVEDRPHWSAGFIFGFATK